MAKLSKFQAVRMGSEHFQLMRQAAEAARPALAADFRRRADILAAALLAHGWRLTSFGNIERVR